MNAFDIETRGSDNEFVMGSIVGDSTSGGEPEVYWDKIDMLDALLSRRFSRGHMYATNLQFDLMGVIDTDYLLDNGYDWEIFHNGSNIIYGKIYKTRKRARENGDTETVIDHSWQFRDTLNIAPRFSVEAMGEVIGLPKLSMDFDEKGIDAYSDKYIEGYNVRDSKITYRFMKWFRNELHDLGGNLQITAAKTSMDYFRRNYLGRPIDQPVRDIIDKCYEGYYGGRVSPFVKGKIDGPIYCYDIASLYPHCLKIGSFPDTDTIRFTRNSCDRGFIDKFEGMSKVSLKVGDIHKPIIPYRTEDKLLFPSGHIPEVWVCHNELRYALERGYEILDIHEQIYATESFNPFADFIDSLYDKRMQYKEEGNESEIIVKLLMNSFYGKLGQRIKNPDGGTYRPIDNMSVKELDGVTVLGNGWAVDKTDETDYFPEYINPILAAYVTAEGRTQLYDWFEKIEGKGGETFYCDTDSVYTDTKLDVGGEKVLGGMDYEGTFDNMWVFGPKFYVVEKDGDFYKTAKGVPYKVMDDMWQAIRDGKDEIEYHKIAKMREAIRKGIKPNSEFKTSRSINLDAPTKRKHKISGDIVSNRIDTEPVRIKPDLDVSISDYVATALGD